MDPSRGVRLGPATRKELLEKELRRRRTLPSEAAARLEASINLGYDDFERVQAAWAGEAGPTAVIKQFFRTTTGRSRSS